MNTIITCFEKKMRLSSLSSKTIRSYLKHIINYNVCFSQNFVIDDVAEYLNALKIKVDNRQLSRSHYNQVQYAFDKFWQIFFNKRFPLLSHIKVPMLPPEIIPEQKIIEAFQKIENNQYGIIVSLAYFSMLRRAEIWHLDLYKDIDLNANKVYIRAGKGWKPRVTPLAKFTKQLIINEIEERKSQKNHNPWVCAKPGSQNRYICYSEVGRIISLVGSKVQCNNWHPHLLRHTGSSHLDMQGISTRKIQVILGHSKLTTTQGYLHPTQDKVLEVMNQLDAQLLQCSNRISNNG